MKSTGIEKTAGGSGSVLAAAIAPSGISAAMMKISNRLRRVVDEFIGGSCGRWNAKGGQAIVSRPGPLLNSGVLPPGVFW